MYFNRRSATTRASSNAVSPLISERFWRISSSPTDNDDLQRAIDSGPPRSMPLPKETEQLKFSWVFRALLHHPCLADGCPAGQRAIWRFTTVENGMTIHKYWSSACPRCPIKSQCTTSDYRRIARWEHENVLDAMQRRLNRTPRASRIRRQTVEHPFGTLKAWMGAKHFLTKTMPRVSTEMSLHVGLDPTVVSPGARAMSIAGLLHTLRGSRK
jgi:Transposase DDE domain